MLILFNIKLEEQEKFYLALNKVYGLGNVYSKNLCARLGISFVAKVIEVDMGILKSLLKYLNAECFVERELKARVISDIQNKIKLKTYQGRRHMQGLPVHGQNTKNNSKTAKKLLKESVIGLSEKKNNYNRKNNNNAKKFKKVAI